MSIYDGMVNEWIVEAARMADLLRQRVAEAEMLWDGTGEKPTDPQILETIYHNRRVNEEQEAKEWWWAEMSPGDRAAIVQAYRYDMRPERPE